MNRKSLFAAIALATTASAVSAQDYNVEINASLGNSDFVDTVEVGGEYHFNMVDTSNKPLEEAAYLTRSNNLQLTYSNEETDASFEILGITFDLSSEATSVAILGEFYLGDIFYIAPGYASTDIDFSDPGESVSEDSIFAALGFTPVDGMRISTIWQEEGDYDLNLEFKYVTQLAGGKYVNLEAGYEDGGNGGADDTISIGGDYYLDNTLSFGGAIIDKADTDFELRAKKFFTPVISAGIRYRNSDADDMITLEGAVRF